MSKFSGILKSFGSSITKGVRALCPLTGSRTDKSDQRQSREGFVQKMSKKLPKKLPTYNVMDDLSQSKTRMFNRYSGVIILGPIKDHCKPETIQRAEDIVHNAWIVFQHATYMTGGPKSVEDQKTRKACDQYKQENLQELAKEIVHDASLNFEHQMHKTKSPKFKFSEIQERKLIPSVEKLLGALTLAYVHSTKYSSDIEDVTKDIENCENKTMFQELPKPLQTICRIVDPDLALTRELLNTIRRLMMNKISYKQACQEIVRTVLEYPITKSLSVVGGSVGGTIGTVIGSLGGPAGAAAGCGIGAGCGIVVSKILWKRRIVKLSKDIIDNFSEYLDLITKRHTTSVVIGPERNE